MNKLSTCVVITTYNGSKYICEQLQSIINQDVSLDKIYIFDDNSIDDTVEKMKQFFLNCYRKIDYKIIINEKSKGWKKNFIDALYYVQEDIIFIADQDDIWVHNKTEVMLDIMVNNQDISLLTSNYELLYCDGCKTKEKNAEERRLKKNDRLVKIKCKDKNFYVRQPGCTFCVRKTLLDRCLKYWNENLPHDALLWQFALVNGELYSINKPLIKWRRHSNNETNKRVESYKTRKLRIDSDDLFVGLLKNDNNNNKFINRASKYFSLRKKMFNNRNFLSWLIIFIKYRKFYVSLKSCLGDLYYILFK